MDEEITLTPEQEEELSNGKGENPHDEEQLDERNDSESESL